MINKITTELMLLDNFPDAQNYNSWNEYADSVYNFFLKMGVFSQNEIDFKTELNNIIDEMNIDITEIFNVVAAQVSQDALEAKQARDEAVGAVATLPEGIVNNDTITETDTWSSKKIDTEIKDKSVSLAQLQATALYF